MTWEDESLQKFKQAMEQFKGESYPCALCGEKGKFDEDIEPLITVIGQWGVEKDNTYTASVNTSFACKDHEACKQRRAEKGLK